MAEPSTTPVRAPWFDGMRYVLTFAAEQAAKRAGARLTQEVITAAQELARRRCDVYQGMWVVYGQDVTDALVKVHGV